MMDALSSLTFHVTAPTGPDSPPPSFENDDIVATFVTRASLLKLGEDSNVSGCYLLVSAPDPDGVRPLYVGLSLSLTSRVMTHFSQYSLLPHALLIRSAARPFDNAQIAYLERALYDRLDERQFVTLTNSRVPTGTTLLAPEKALRLHTLVVPSVMAVLRAIGIDPDSTPRAPLNFILETDPSVPVVSDAEEPDAEEPDAEEPACVVGDDLPRGAEATGVGRAPEPCERAALPVMAEAPQYAVSAGEREDDTWDRYEADHATPPPEDLATSWTSAAALTALDPGAAGTLRTGRRGRPLVIVARDLFMLRHIDSTNQATYETVANSVGTSNGAIRRRVPRLMDARLVKHEGTTNSGARRLVLTEQGIALLRLAAVNTPTAPDHVALDRGPDVVPGEAPTLPFADQI